MNIKTILSLVILTIFASSTYANKTNILAVTSNGEITKNLSQKNVLLVQKPTETKNKFFLRAGLVFLKKQKHDNALNLFSASFNAQENDSALFFLAECFIKKDDFKNALRANYGAQYGNKKLKPAILYQRYQIFLKLSMTDEAKKTAQEIIKKYGNTSYAKKCKKDYGITPKWKPKVSLKLKSYYERNTENNIDINDSVYTKWNNYAYSSLKWKLWGNNKTKIFFNPNAKLYIPPNKKNSACCDIGSRINTEIENSGYKTSILGLSYNFSKWNDISTFHDIEESYSIISVTEDLKTLFFSILFQTQLSPDKDYNNYSAFSILDIDPIFKFGKNYNLELSLSSMYYSKFKNDDLRDNIERIYASGIIAGTLKRQAHYFSDSTYTNEEVLGMRDIQGIPTYTVAKQKAGVLKTNPMALFSTEVTVEKDINKLSVEISTYYGITIYTLPYEWDNLSENENLVFYNKEDKKEYILVPEKTNFSFAPTSYRFYEYKHYKKYRIDHNLRLGLKAFYYFKNIGLFTGYIDFITNISSIEKSNNAFATYSYTEIEPGIFWTVSF